MGPPEFHVDGASYKGSSKERWVHVSPLLMQMFHCPIGPHLQTQIQKHSDSEFQDSDSKALNQAQGSPECMGIHAQTHTNTQERQGLCDTRVTCLQSQPRSQALMISVTCIFPVHTYISNECFRQGPELLQPHMYQSELVSIHSFSKHLLSIPVTCQILF